MEHDMPFYSISSAYFFNPENESPLLDDSKMRSNIESIERDVAHLSGLFSTRLKEFDSPGSIAHSLSEWPIPVTGSGPYSDLCATLQPAERVLLLFSLLPHFAPEVLRIMVSGIQNGLVIDHPMAGGFIKRTTLQFIPNIQTVLFTCAGRDKSAEQNFYRQLMLDGSLLKRQIVTLRPFDYSESVFSEREMIPELAEEFVQYLLQGRQPRPDFGKNFPAKLLTTDKTWDQLILNRNTLKDVELMADWLEHGALLANDSKGFFSPGYPVLFYGPPGTGKSMTAALIGKRCNLNVFRVDASRIVSKYIGETEKNIVQLFQRMKLENSRGKNKPVLFFDEADVLFSKRTEVRDAKDKWANLETSVLLPLIEDYEGLVIVATNLERNIDPAMDRRFQLKIKFPTPSYEERVQVWQRGLPPMYSYPSAQSAIEMARYRLSPASIINVLKGGCIQANKRGSNVIIGQDLEYYVGLEFGKSGITAAWDNIPASFTLG